jgi:predicted transport protein
MTPRNPGEMMAAVSASLQERTGRTLDEWLAVVASSGIDPLDQNAVRRWLKHEHGIAQNTQWAIVDAAARAAGWERPSIDEYIDGQYTGEKAALRPIFDAVRTNLESLGDDVTIEGRATYIPFIRRRQFAAVAAATRTRVDIGLRFTDAPPSDHLTPANAPGQATHRVSLTSVADVTSGIRRLLRTAYDQNG